MASKRRTGKDAFTGRKTKSGPVTKRIESSGVRKRLGRPVKDATEPLIMPLTKKDIERARKIANGYEVDDPENFFGCTVACALKNITGAEVAVMRKHAFIALPGDDFTTRYCVDPSTSDIITLNDEERFDEIPANVNLKLRVPTPSNRLAAQRARQKKHNNYSDTRGSGRKQTKVDPYRGVWRNGQFFTED